MNTDHIICYDGTMGDDAYAFHCKHCGETRRVVTPISIADLVAIGKVFTKHHRGCKPKDAEQRSEP